MHEKDPHSPLIIHDSPIRLVFKIIAVSLLFSLLFLVTAVISERNLAFDNGFIIGIITYDIFTFFTLVVLQQAITLVLLVKWLKRYYVVDREGITVKICGGKPPRLTLSGMCPFDSFRSLRVPFS